MHRRMDPFLTLLFTLVVELKTVIEPCGRRWAALHYLAQFHDLDVDIPIEFLRHRLEVMMERVQHLLLPRRVDGHVAVKNNRAICVRSNRRGSEGSGSPSSSQPCAKFQQRATIHRSSGPDVSLAIILA